MKDKNHMILSIESKKAFDKIQHPFVMKILSNMGIERAYLNMIKAIYKKSTANIILNGKKNKSFPLKIRNKTSVFAFTIFIQHSIGSSSHRDQQEKEIKGI